MIIASVSAKPFRIGTLQYDIFVNGDGTEYVVHERYRDCAALLEHLANLGDLMNAYLQICSISGEVLGTPSPELKKGLDSAGVRVFTPYQSV